MDNLTHTLVGVLVGETGARISTPTAGGLPEQQRRNLFVTLMAVGSSVPDLDFLSSAISGDKLEYLLEHRGYTHTVVGALIGAAVLFAASLAFCRWRQWHLAPRDRLQLAGVALLALLLHVTMDFTNNYGVHPFWPFENRWLYGDTIFIWEPLLWAAAAPLVFVLRTKIARALVAVLLIAAISACFGSGLVPLGFSILMVLLTGGMLLLGRYATRRTALLAGVTVWLSVTAVFAVSHSVAESQLRVFVPQQLPDATVLEYVLTPMPADPLCWDVMLPMTSGDRYIIRHGTWSLMPGLMPAHRCPGRGLFTNITAPMTAIEAGSTPTMFWRGEMTMPREQIARIAAANCEAAAFMRFARVPWSLRKEDSWIVGDLRYDREPELGFAELELKDGESRCPAHVPPWLPPRNDLLR